MKIAILEEAREDLIQGFRFYEGQEPGLGAYFLDCLFSDIDSLLVYAGIHLVTYTNHDASPSGFHLQSTTAWKGNWFVCMLCWIVAEIPRGSESDSRMMHRFGVDAQFFTPSPE
mgnify:FL=1